jgi:hypothetical protein
MAGAAWPILPEPTKVPFVNRASLARRCPVLRARQPQREIRRKEGHADANPSHAHQLRNPLDGSGRCRTDQSRRGGCGSRRPGTAEADRRGCQLRGPEITLATLPALPSPHCSPVLGVAEQALPAGGTALLPSLLKPLRGRRGGPHARRPTRTSSPLRALLLSPAPSPLPPAVRRQLSSLVPRSVRMR